MEGRPESVCRALRRAPDDLKDDEIAVRNEMESGKTKSVEASEIAAFSAIESGSQRRAIPDVSTALLRMISDDGQIQFRSDDGRRFPATYCAGPIASEPVTQRSGQGRVRAWQIPKPQGPFKSPLAQLSF